MANNNKGTIVDVVIPKMGVIVSCAKYESLNKLWHSYKSCHGD